MPNQFVVYVGSSYKVAEVLKFPFLNDECLTRFMAHQPKLRMHGVVLRDGQTGKRYTFAEAMASWCSKWKCMDVRRRDNGKWGIYILTDLGWLWGSGLTTGVLEFDSEHDALQALARMKT